MIQTILLELVVESLKERWQEIKLNLLNSVDLGLKMYHRNNIQYVKLSEFRVSVVAKDTKDAIVKVAVWQKDVIVLNLD